LKNLSNTNKSTDDSVDECCLSDDHLGGLFLVRRAIKKADNSPVGLSRYFERLLLTIVE